MHFLHFVIGLFLFLAVIVPATARKIDRHVVSSSIMSVGAAFLAGFILCDGERNKPLKSTLGNVSVCLMFLATLITWSGIDWVREKWATAVDKIPSRENVKAKWQSAVEKIPSQEHVEAEWKSTVDKSQAKM